MVKFSGEHVVPAQLHLKNRCNSIMWNVLFYIVNESSHTCKYTRRRIKRTTTVATGHLESKQTTKVKLEKYSNLIYMYFTLHYFIDLWNIDRDCACLNDVLLLKGSVISMYETTQTLHQSDT